MSRPIFVTIGHDIANLKNDKKSEKEYSGDLHNVDLSTTGNVFIHVKCIGEPDGGKISFTAKVNGKMLNVLTNPIEKTVRNGKAIIRRDIGLKQE